MLKDAEALRLLTRRIRVPAFFLSHQGLLTLGLLGVFLFFSVSSEHFRNPENLRGLIFPVTTLGFVSIGIVFELIVGVIDLSVGSIIGVGGAVMAGLISAVGMPAPLAIIVVAMVGMLLGLFNGLLVTWLRVPSFIITMATLGLFRIGTVLIHLEFFGTTMSFGVPNDAYRWFGSVDVMGGVPVSFYIFVCTALLAYYILAHSKLGIRFFAVGGNERSAHAGGISPDRMRILAFVISGACAATAGAALTARFQGGTVLTGLGFEFEAITVALIGGASLYGGYGSIVGAMLGVVFVKVLTNGFINLDVPSFDQYLIRAAIFIVILWVDANFRHRRRGRYMVGA